MVLWIVHCETTRSMSTMAMARSRCGKEEAEEGSGASTLALLMMERIGEGGRGEGRENIVPAPL
jgi:hypothetical protein